MSLLKYRGPISISSFVFYNCTVRTTNNGRGTLEQEIRFGCYVCVLVAEKIHILGQLASGVPKMAHGEDAVRQTVWRAYLAG